MRRAWRRGRGLSIEGGIRGVSLRDVDWLAVALCGREGKSGGIRGFADVPFLGFVWGAKTRFLPKLLLKLADLWVVLAILWSVFARSCPVFGGF